MIAAAFLRAVRAESTRIWSVRSSWILAAITAAAVLLFGAMVGQSDPSDVTPGSTAWDGGQLGGMFALFGILALSVVVATADFGTGGIVPTLQWTPRRGVLFAARCATVVGTTTLLGCAFVAGASVVVQASLNLGLPLGEGLEVIGGVAFLFAAGALMSVGLGLLLRSTAGALVLVIALILVLPMLLAQLGYDWSTTVATHLPGSGALFLIFGEGPSENMTTTSARLTLAAWAIGTTLLGAWRLIRTDAHP
jgi:ABC-2 type transport system permease protein